MPEIDRPLPRYLPVPGPDLSVPWQELYGPYPEESISKKRKERIFAGDIARIDDLFSEHGLTIPPNLLDRLLVLGYTDYRRSEKKYAFSRGATGFCLNDSSVGFVSKWHAQEDAKRHKVSFESALRATGVHELFHTLQFGEWWMSTDVEDKDYKRVRRNGFLTTRPTSVYPKDISRDLESRGQRRLDEGFTDYLTERITGLDDNPKAYIAYPEEVKVVKYLIEQIGFDPLFLANYTRHGFRLFYEKMRERFGSSGFRLLFITMGSRYLYWRSEKGKMVEGEREIVPKLDYSIVINTLEQLKTDNS